MDCCYYSSFIMAGNLAITNITNDFEYQTTTDDYWQRAALSFGTNKHEERYVK
jgi:hypothetical protein